MLSDYRGELEEIAGRLDKIRSTFDIGGKRTQAEELEKQAARPDLWDDQDRARRILGELSALKDAVDTWERLAAEQRELEELAQLAQEEDDASLTGDIGRGVGKLRRDVDRLEEESLLSGEFDASDAIVSIHSGAGGLESQDWAEMLLRMYLRWAESRGFKADLNDMQPGEGGGIKSATFTAHGRFAYGLFLSEMGVHRLVRISPYDASSRRHTSFASVDVIPMLEREESVEIDPKDLRVETYRSSGAGGQHVNVTDSAVRITHIPSGIVVSCQNERSQISNRATAMRILASRLADRSRREREDEIEKLRGEKMDIGFGSQIRSYVLHPYRMAKDHRTGMEIGNVDAVLDGDLDDFIDAYLRWKTSQ
ncbi:MAG: peptide chain release factor 2 [Actinomycetota bacterium]|nr:peptide chain release factor 2 [Actinomycetota bacterium]MDD5666675.1 peptide chain release factor 2 [Actinomycetota bacterium]